jgi:hypothetical protein
MHGAYVKKNLEKLFYANHADLLAENKHTFCKGNERAALLVASYGVSVVTNAQVKAGKIHNAEGWVNKCFEGLNIGNNLNNSKNKLIKN